MHGGVEELEMEVVLTKPRVVGFLGGREAKGV